MKKIKEQLADYRKLNISQLDAKLNEAKVNYQDLASQISMGKLKTTASLKVAKKEVARLATIKQEQAIIAEVTNG